MTAFTGQMYRNTRYTRPISIQTPYISTKVTTTTRGEYGQSYSAFQEDGTREHSRDPNAPLMVFYLDGRLIKTKYVRGTPARRMFHKAYEALSVNDYLSGRP